MVAQAGVSHRIGRGSLTYALLAASALGAGGVAALLLTRHRVFAGLVALVASSALLWAVATEPPATRGEGSRSLFAGRVLDRGLEACILVPLAWVSRAGSDVQTVLALVGMGASYLASYQRARAEALGYQGAESSSYLATRYAILVLGLLTGWVLASLWAFAVLTSAAAAARSWNVAQQERRSPSPRGTGL